MNEVDKDCQDNWNLESITEKAYLPQRPRFFADKVYIIGAGLATILVFIIFFSK